MPIRQGFRTDSTCHGAVVMGHVSIWLLLDNLLTEKSDSYCDAGHHYQGNEAGIWKEGRVGQGLGALIGLQDVIELTSGTQGIDGHTQNHTGDQLKKMELKSVLFELWCKVDQSVWGTAGGSRITY